MYVKRLNHVDLNWSKRYHGTPILFNLMGQFFYQSVVLMSLLRYRVALILVHSVISDQLHQKCPPLLSHPDPFSSLMNRNTVRGAGDRPLRHRHLLRRLGPRGIL